MNPEILTLESTQALYASVPTDEEMENIKEFLKNNEQELLGKAEQFFIIVRNFTILLDDLDEFDSFAKR